MPKLNPPGLKLVPTIYQEPVAYDQKQFAKAMAQYASSVATFRNVEAAAGSGASKPLAGFGCLELIQVISNVIGRPLNGIESERLAQSLIVLGAIQAKPQGPSMDNEVILAKLTKIEGLLEAQPAVETEWVPVKTFVAMTKKSVWIINNSCRLGLLRCRKIDNGTGTKAQWRILKTEAKRVIEEGFGEQVQPPYDPNDN